MKWNIQFIMHYKHPRQDFDKYSAEILKRARYFDNPTIDYLEKSFVAKVDFRDILPLVYHLIFLGELKVNLVLPIDQFSVVSIGNLSEDLFTYFNLESGDK